MTRQKTTTTRRIAVLAVMIVIVVTAVTLGTRHGPHVEGGTQSSMPDSPV